MLCNTMQHTATQCNTVQQYTCNALQRSATLYNTLHSSAILHTTVQHYVSAIHCNIVQHCTIHCNTVQHYASQCNTTQHRATLCVCNTLQHTATLYFELRADMTQLYVSRDLAAHYHTMQKTSTRCNTLQHTIGVLGLSSRWYRVAKNHRIPYLYRSFPAKVTYL